MAYMQLGAPLADYGTFGAPLAQYGLGAPKRKKKRGLLRRVGRVAKKVGKVALKAAPVVAGLTLGPAGGIVVGAASGAIGRGKPKFKRILRGAAIGGATGLVRTAGGRKIIAKGAKAAGRLVRSGGRVVGKLGKGAGKLIENIAKGDIGPGEGAVIGAGGGLIVEQLKKRRKRPRPEAQMPDEPLPPEELPPRPPAVIPELPPEGYPRPPIDFLPPELQPPQAAPAPGEPTPSPAETPTSGQLPVAGGLVPDTATNAIMPGSGGEQFAPARSEEVVPDETKKGPNMALLAAAGVAVVLIMSRPKKRRR